MRGARDPPRLLLCCVDLVLSEVMGLLHSVSATGLELLRFRTPVFLLLCCVNVGVHWVGIWAREIGQGWVRFLGENPCVVSRNAAGLLIGYWDLMRE